MVSNILAILSISGALLVIMGLISGKLKPVIVVILFALCGILAEIALEVQLKEHQSECIKG